MCEKLQVIDDLCDREVNGYKAIFVPIYKWNKERDCTDDGNIITKKALTFQAGIDNKSYAGFVSHDDIVDRVMTCSGDSGPNLDYVLNLAEALDKLGMKDAHVSDLVARIDRQRGAK